MQLLKERRVKLKGKDLKKLNDDIFERDNHKCIVCGQWVEDGVKFHHEPNGGKKSDEINKGVVLCNDCHVKRHFTAQCNEVKQQVQDYLAGIYGQKQRTVHDGLQTRRKTSKDMPGINRGA